MSASRASERRRGAAAWLVLLVGVAGGACDSSGDELAGATEGAESGVRADPRLAELLQPCNRSHFYQRPDPDLLPILMEKLEQGRGDPLKRAKEELGALGEEAGGELRRFFDRNFANALAAPLLENALDAASLNSSEAAHELLLRALQHPMNTVRHRAMLGLSGQAARETDFEFFRKLLDESSDGNEIRRLQVRVLFQADPDRAARLGIEWIEAGREPALWSEFLTRLPVSTDPDVLAGASRIWDTVDNRQTAWLAVPAVRAGDERARAWLDEELEANPHGARLSAIQALGMAGMEHEIVEALRYDLEPELRVIALAALGDMRSEESRIALEAALDDPNPSVRSQALKSLCARHDPQGIARALSQLGEETGDLQSALLALREPVDADPEVARAMFEALVERHELESHRPYQQRTPTFKAMGQVPLREATRFLRAIGLEAEGERLEGLRAHDWLMIQASNTGAEGRQFLFEELAGETDPLRRLDLIAAIGSTREADARELLLGVLEGAAYAPTEKLMAASRLVKIGPAGTIAPRVKRVAWEMGDPDVQKALNCLLWEWY